MQIFSPGGNLHEMSNLIFWGKNKKIIINLSSAEFALTVVMVNLTIIGVDLTTWHFINNYFVIFVLSTVFDPITAHTPISAQSSNFVVFRVHAMYLLLYKSICCWYSFELPRQVLWYSNVGKYSSISVQ